MPPALRVRSLSNGCTECRPPGGAAVSGYAECVEWPVVCVRYFLRALDTGEVLLSFLPQLAMGVVAGLTHEAPNEADAATRAGRCRDRGQRGQLSTEPSIWTP